METRATRKKFDIVNTEPPYVPLSRPLPPFTTVQTLDSRCEDATNDSHRLYLTEEAMNHITSHVGWGSHTQHNCIEQGGILVGQSFRDRDTRITYAVVQAAIAGLSARGSSVHLEMTHNTWKEMLDSVDRLLDQSPQAELQVVGWYHTHPNGLQVFMSGVDLETQRRLFAHDWQFAIVLNPQKKCWRAFFGEAAVECPGYVITDSQNEMEPAEARAPVVINEERREPETQMISIGARSGLFPRLRQRLTVWKNSTPRLLRAGVIMLGLVLILQCAILGILVKLVLRR